LFGIGIDVVETARIRDAIERHGGRFLARVFTDDEVRYCQARRFPELAFGARFAAKEAVAKALGTGFGADVGWRDVEVVHTASGAPEVRLHGPAADFVAKHGVTEVKVSLTHTEHYAAANAVAVCAG
jgi:holo-[acyl-carrier protein] synthase